MILLKIFRKCKKQRKIRIFYQNVCETYTKWPPLLFDGVVKNATWKLHKKQLAYLAYVVYNNEEGKRSHKERIAPAKQSAQEYNVPAGHDDRLGQGSVI